MRVIDVEHHFVTPLYTETLRANKTAPRAEDGKGVAYFEDTWVPTPPAGPGRKLADMGEGRIREMDEAGIDLAMLSLTAPGVEPFEPAVSTRVARDANDRLAEYVAAYPDRLDGWATVPVRDHEESVKELERCVNELGFKGWHTHSNFGDSYLDEKRYWPLLAKVEELGVPIYLHPTAPMIPELRTFGYCLAGPTFGFGVEVMYVFLRMIHRGVFDEFPKLKIILGHFGEAIPFLLDRVDTAYRQGYSNPRPEVGPGSAEPASYYVRKHLWVTSSGNYLPAAFHCTREALGVDKMLLGTDYPFEQLSTGVDFLRERPISGDEMMRICESNAVELLRLSDGPEVTAVSLR